MQLDHDRSWLRGRDLQIVALYAAIALLIALASGCAPQLVEEPVLWQLEEAEINQSAFDHDGMWTSYRLPPDYKTDSGSQKGGLPLNASIDEV